MDDIFTALRESTGNDGELTNHSLALFGICTVPGYSSGSVLLELAKETNRNQRDGLELLHPAGGKKKKVLSDCNHFCLECCCFFSHDSTCLVFSISARGRGR